MSFPCRIFFLYRMSSFSWPLKCALHELMQVFLKGPSLYAFKGLAGRFAPIGVHIALLLIMAGGTLSATGSFKGSVTVPQGLNFVMGDVLGPSSFLSIPTEGFNTEVHVNRFYMDYYESGEVGSITLLFLINMNLLTYSLSSHFSCRFHSSTLIFHSLTLTGRR